MAANRLPADKASVSGAAIKNAGRFKDRKKPKGTRPLGRPYTKMTAPQKKAWKELAGDMPWLNSSHRTLLRLACIWAAKMENDDFGVSATQALSSILSKLGATPVDETKVNYDPAQEDDPEEDFFSGTKKVSH